MDVHWVDDALTVGDDVARVALGALVVQVEGFTVEVDKDASTALVEPVLGRTFETDLLVPVPAGTAEVSGAVEVDLRKDTVSVGEVEAFVAGGALVELVEGLAVVVKLLANSVAVEDKPF